MEVPEWKLMKFDKKYNLGMRQIFKNRKNIKIDDDVRLFLYKPKNYEEMIYEIYNLENLENISYCVRIHFNCLGKLDEWSGKFSYEFKDFPIKKSSIRKQDHYIHFDVENLGNLESNGIKLADGWLEFSNFHEGEIELQKETDKFMLKSKLRFDTDNMVVNGFIEMDIKVTIDDYRNMTNYRVVRKYYISSDNFWTARATYKIIKKNNNKYVGKLTNKFLSKDNRNLPLPKILEFNFKDIFQFANDVDENIVYTYKSTKNVTDWSGQCLDPITRSFIDVDDIVRCRLCYYEVVKPEEILEIGRVYFKVLEIDDEYFYGELQDPYNQGEDEYNLRSKFYPFPYAVIKLSKKCISEIPISWQPDERQKLYEKHLLDSGYMMTGSTVE